jgi:uncharacterized protein (TIGR01777 family)
MMNPMRLFITGATGLIGRRVVIDRLERGDHVVLLSRDPARAAKLFAAEANRKITVIGGNPASPGNWQKDVGGCDAVIHLAGVGLADHRWTAAHKKVIVSSRVDSTHQVVNAIEQAPAGRRSRVLVCGSATGYYGEAGDRELDEGAPAGDDFLARLCVQWESQAKRAESLGMRVVLMRSAVVLDNRGGMLKQMMPVFKLGLGGSLGSGKQYLPWIHWRDWIGLLDLALERDDVNGPLNAVAPQAVRQREFARALGVALHRPAFLPVPRFALRLALGEIANALTTSQRAVPAKALQLGYAFLYPTIEAALNDLVAFDNSRPTASDHPDAEGCRSDAMNAGGPQSAKSKSTTAPAAPIKLLAIAVDGALLNSQGALTSGVIQACRAAERAGCVVVLATARPPRGVKSIMQSLDIASPTINYNGAVIWNSLDNKPQFHQPLEPDVAQDIVRSALAMLPELIVSVEVLDRWIINRIDEQLMPFATSPHLGPHAIGGVEKVLAEPITKLELIALRSQVAPVLEMIREKYWRSKQVAIFTSPHDDAAAYSAPVSIQIFHPLVDKGIALQRIAKRMNLARDQVMAIGDSSNDLGMIEWAGFGVAVENAADAVRDLADTVVPSNDEAGAARAIQRYVLSPR